MARSRDVWKAMLQRATTDAAFRRKLKSKPDKALAEAGIAVEKGVEYIVVEDKPKKKYIVLQPLEKAPPPEEKGKLSEDELNNVSAGSSAVFGNPNPDKPWPPE